MVLSYNMSAIVQAFQPHLNTVHIGADTQSPTQGSLTRAVVAGRQDEPGTTGAVVAAVDVVTVVLTPPVVYGTLVDVCNGISSITYTSEDNPNQIQWISLENQPPFGLSMFQLYQSVVFFNSRCWYLIKTTYGCKNNIYCVPFYLQSVVRRNTLYTPLANTTSVLLIKEILL